MDRLQGALLLGLGILLGSGQGVTAAPVGVFDDAVDIGVPPAAGLTTVDGSVYTLQGSGADIWDGGDDFHFAYKRVAGDFTATIRVLSRSTTPAGSGTWGRYGLMARWGTAANSKYSMVSCVLPTEDAPQAAFAPFYQFRLYDFQSDGNRINYSASDSTFPAEGRMPSWMRLVRRSSTIYGYLAEDADADGQPDRWCLMGSDTGIYPGTLLVGAALHSQAGGNLGTITFDNAAIERLPAQAPLECADGDVFLESDFEAGFGDLAGSVRIGLPSPVPYAPRVRSGRLRLAEDGYLSAGSAVWYDVAGSEALTQNGFVAEFDAFMTKAGLPGDANPADGMTFAAVQGGSEILGFSEDRTEPSIPRFTNTALVWTGAGCQPTAPSAFTRDLTPGAGVSFSTVQSDGDIWNGGDTFSYQYAQVTGDFDLSVQVVSYGHGTGAGRWGKYGLMARQTLDPTSRYTMAQAHGPVLDDPARQAGRLNHLDAGAVGYEVVFPGLGARPQFLRLTRRGSVIQGWASDNAGLADGTLSRCNDLNWVAGSPDDWGGSAPATIFLGFANSNHGSAGCTTQSIFYQGLPACSATPVGRSDLLGYGGGGLGYGGGVLLARTVCHPSFAVEMDNWVGGGEPGNDPYDAGAPSYDGKYHFGLDVDAEVTSVQTNVDFGVPTGTLPDIFDPAGVHVKVRYAPDGQIEVFARANKPPFGEYLVLSERIPPFSGSVLLGFTAGTGAATATHEVDNFSVKALSCTVQPPSSLAPKIIDLGNITGGGDGLRDTPAVFTGVDPRNGAFTSGYFDGRLNDTDGVYLAPGPSPYIDSVFYVAALRGPEFVLPSSLTQSGVGYYFPSSDESLSGPFRSGWNYILKDRNGGVSDPAIPIQVGPITGWTTAVGIHAATGITYNLDALRAQHGASNVRCFSTTWGLDGCASGDVNLYAILSSDAGGVIAERRFHATAANSWGVAQMPIPASAQYLSLATGANGVDNCDHGTFARAVITGAPCPSYSSFTWLWAVVPSLVSTAGGDVTFVGEFLSPDDTLRVGGFDLTDSFYINGELYSGRLPPMSPGFYDAEVINSDGFVVTARLKNAVEVTPPVAITAVEPRDVFRDAETQVTVRGENFRPTTTISIELIPDADPFDLIDPVFVSETEITGRVPPLPEDQPNGFRKVIARDTRGEAELAPGVQYVDPSGVRLTAVDPPIVPTQGGMRVTFTGGGFSEGLFTPRLGGEPLSDVVFLSETALEGTSPPLPAGFHAADLERLTGGVIVTLPDAVEAVPPVELGSVTPRNVLSDGTTPVIVHGLNFRALTRIQVGGRDLVAASVAADGLSVAGTAPALDAGDPLGPRDVTALDPRGDAVLEAGVTYVSPPAVTITRVDPSAVLTIGGTSVTFVGSNFRSGVHTPRLGGKTLTNVAFVDATRMRGTSPALAAGFHAAEVIGPDGTVVATLVRAVEATPPLTLISVTPSQVLSSGTTPVTVRGTGFRAQTRIQVGGRDLAGPSLGADGTTITGNAPALAAGETLGSRDVTALDARGNVTLRSGVTYTAPPAPPPGPQEIEGTFAEGKARFRWYNPLPYSSILVTDLNDNLIATLPGKSNFYELATAGRDRADIKLRGIVGEDTSAPSDASAMRHECERPAPLVWGGVPGDLNLTLYGKYPAGAVTRCTPPMGLGGGAAGEAVDDARGSSGGFLAKAKTIGWMVQQELNATALAGLYTQKPTKLVSGFVLDKAADKLEIAAHYEKLATAFDLELRCRLVHVFPADGFVDEFTMPDIVIGRGKQLNCITYFRADKDIGHPGNPADPDPAKQPPRSCKLQIPAGEYLLELYAVGGDARLPYYLFADDPHDDEILIAGVTCPPYPLLRVTDLTGLRTLPDITVVDAEPETFFIANCTQGSIFRYLKARGLWLDELNQEHDVQTDSSPHFEYIWTVHDRVPPRTVSTSSRATLKYCFNDWGCYKVDLRVRDLQCGFEKTRTFEVPVRPSWNETACAPAPFTFLYPTPDPSWIYAVIGLKAPNAPLGQGSFNGRRPLAMRVLVVPQCYCADPDESDCPGALLGPDDESDLDDAIQFRLAFKTPGNGRQRVEGVKIRVKDLCPNVPTGAKYFFLEVDDLGTIPPQPAWAQREFKDIFVQGRTRPANNDPNVGWRDVGEAGAHPMHFANRPSSLDQTFWSGHFVEEDQSYHFLSQSSKKPQASVPIDASKPITLPLPGVAVGIPSYDNDIAAGFTSRFGVIGPKWFAEEGSGASSGQLLGNEMSGAPVQVKAVQVGGGGGEGEGGIVTPPRYEWCDHREILSEHFSQTLFESILYTGLIGPIPVTIWASIGLGLDILVESYTTVKVSPFAPLTGGSFAETHFYLLSQTDLSIPCEIRADVVGGIISIALRLIPSAQFILDTHVWSRDAEAHADLFTKATLDLSMQIEACLNLLFAKICAGATIPILEDVPLMDPVGTDPRPPVTCGGGGGGGLADAAAGAEQGGGAGIIKFDLPYQSISAPVTVVSPDRKSRMEISFDQDGISNIKVNSELAETPTFSLSVGDLLNPAATFVSNRGGLIAWTRTYCSDSGLGSLCKPTEFDPDPTLAQRNLMHGQQEVVISPITRTMPVEPGVFPKWLVGEPIRIADPEAEVPNVADRRADGMAAITADLTALDDVTPGGEAIVAWVRYEGDYLIQDGFKTIYVNPCADDNPPKACDFVEQSVPNIRPQMELTAIYTRRVSLAGLLPGEDKVKISPPGINVEPAVSLSPAGDVGYCVWVHDPTHTNLIDTNRGRMLLYSVYSAGTNSWSAPASVLSSIADYDAKYPGVLEPHMALKDAVTGLLVFTAVGKDAPVTDSGLAGSRFVYGVRLQGGVFGEPFLIHGRCLRRQYGWIPQVVYDLPDLIDPFSKFKWKQPDWVMAFQGVGPIGLAEGAGNVFVTVIGQGMDSSTPAQPLFSDGNIRSNVAASLANGVLHTLSLNSGLARVSAIRAALGAGGGVEPRQRFFESVETPLQADMAVVSCRITDPFSAPGSRVTAHVTIENQGFAGSPVNVNDGRSAVRVQAVYVADDGSERVFATEEVPELQPGETTPVMLALEMPLDPVRVRVELFPNPIDRDPTNDSRECLLGAPAPKDVTCELFTAEDEAGTPAVDLSWTNAAVYDEVVIYRDGSMLASLPGACARFVDLYEPQGPVEYAVRGRMGASKSSRTAVVCGFVPPETIFRRGDSDGNGQLQLTDAVRILNVLFLGTGVINCSDAADADDNGQLQLTDAVRILNVLFLGTGVIRPPGPPPDACGVDPTEDGLDCVRYNC